jgi:toxin ParE1/3/4
MTSAKIEEYIARDSPLHAVNLVDRLVEATERLETFPLSGRVVPEFERAELREVIFRSYRMVYLLVDDLVTIPRVVHAARDLPRLALDEPSTFE